MYSGHIAHDLVLEMDPWDESINKMLCIETVTDEIAFSDIDFNVLYNKVDFSNQNANQKSTTVNHECTV